ncbi:MAG: hypothetical protein PHO90_01830 [Candidatus Pacebacteria bacterium]|nr:hypothetical protein [Candidatus Paceibacterota bacterium]
MKTLESIVQTENTFYSCYYDNERKKFVFQRIGSSRRPVCALHEPLYLGDSLAIKNSCIVLKEDGRIALKTTRIKNVFEKAPALLV